MTQHPDLYTLREREIQFRRDLVNAFQEAEQVVLDLAAEAVDGAAAQQTNIRLDLAQAEMIRDRFLAVWQTLTKEGAS